MRNINPPTPSSISVAGSGIQQKLARKSAFIPATFHDLRSTALSGWCDNGMEINAIKSLAGHSSIVTTQEFYLAVTSDLVDRARQIKSRTTESVLAHFVTHPDNGQTEAGSVACKSM